MEAIRKILSDAQDSVTVDLPPSFRHRRIEVVVTPLDETAANSALHGLRAWPPGFFDQISGAWKGEPLERAPQGEAEQRTPFD